MAGERLSLQDVMRRRRGGGAFVGRRDEMAVFLGNLGTDPGDEARHVLFHVHGPGGVGKSTLLARLAQEARARGALTATADEDAMTVPAAMAAVAADLAGQDRPLKAFDRLYAAYRQRRHEAEALGVAGSPSAGSAVVAQAGLAGLGLVPGLSLVAGAVDPGRVAEGVDRLRAAGSSRFRTEQDLQLLLDPVAVLSPVFTADLASAAAGARWLTLFFDTYERTGPVLDGWLRDLLLDGRYGALPANVVVTLAGQGALDRAGWAGSLDLVTPLPLGPFSEAEARELLAAKGVTDEAVVGAVLRLTDRLPLLVSTLAATRPSGPEAVGDPADTAVERFLAWERDPAARAAALAAALPLQLDEDVYRVAVGDDVPAAADRYDWLLGLPFVDSAGGHARYHDLVRAQMLRLTRTRSPQRWRDRHERLAAAHAAWRERAARGRSGGDLWADAAWRDHRRHESYHLLCADPGAALADTLLHLCRAATAGADTARRWTRMLAAAATDADAPDLADWSASLAALYRTPPPGATVPAARRGEPQLPPGDALGGERAVAAVSLVLDADVLDREQRAVAYAVRAWAQRQAGRQEAGLADYDRAAKLGLGTFRLYAERAATHWTLGRPEQAAADYALALTADPADPQAQTVRAQRGGALLQAGRTADAIAELDAAVTADPGGTGPARVFRAMALLHLDRPADALADVEERLAAGAPDPDTLALRGLVRQRLGSNEQALADFDTALAGRPDPAPWVLTGRGLALEALGRYADAADSFARAVDQGGATDADTLTHRARLLRLAGRTEQAVAAAGRACAQHPDSAAAARESAFALFGAGRLPEAADAFGRVLALEPGAADALTARARVHVLLGRPAAALADLDQLPGPAPAWLPGRRAQLLVLAGDTAGAAAVLDAAGAHTLDDLLTLAVCHREQRRYAEAAAVLDRADALAPGHGAVALERAVLTTLTDGPDAARPLWLALRTAGEPEGVLPEVFRAVIAAGLGRWDDAGVHIAAVLAARAPWPTRATLSRTLTTLSPPTPLPPPLTAPS